MRIEKIHPAFWILMTALTIVLTAALQTLCDRFYPFNGSRTWVLGLSFGAVLWSLGPMSTRFDWFGMSNSDKSIVAKTEIKSSFEFMVIWTALMMSFYIVIEIAFHQIPILERHWKNNPPLMLGFFQSMGIAKYIAHRKGWIVDRPIETKTTEKS